MSTRQYLIDASTRHQVFIQRYSAGVANDAVADLLLLMRKINAKLLSAKTESKRLRLSRQLDDIEGLIQATMLGINDKFARDMRKFAVSESVATATLYNKVSNVEMDLPSEAALIDYVENAPMLGTPMTPQFEAFGAKLSSQIMSAIRASVVMGETPEEAVKALSGIVKDLGARQLRSLVRTSVNHVSSQARMAVYEANQDIVEGYEWVATLDSKTTIECALRDGVIYTARTDPRPPAHWGCRSTIIFKIKKQYAVNLKSEGTRPSVGLEGAKKVGAQTKFPGWLKSQPKEFIDEYLGKERSKLFRGGALKLDQFVDDQYNILTLDQLENLHPIAFM